MKSTMSYYRGSCIVSAICLLLSGVLGYVTDGTIGAAASMILTASILGALEISLSIDNAVVNASILRHMSPLWQRLFLTIGIIVAVFGMRILFPIVIVAFADDISIMQALHIALNEPKQYQHIMEGCHLTIMGFGASFLLAVFFNFFLDIEKETHWFGIEEHVAQLTGAPKYLSLAALVLLTTGTVASFTTNPMEFMTAVLYGSLVYAGLEVFKELVGGGNITAVAARHGVVGFVYLEVLDSSFSFDGVVAAFALTNVFLLISLGLTIGAVFVRSTTLLMVDKGTLDQYEFLEPAAFYAIGFLVLTMFLSAIGIELGEIVVGLGSIGIIGAGIHSSIKHKKAQQLS